MSTPPIAPEPHKAPGWYTNADGAAQWWDGTNWGVLFSENGNPDASGSRPPVKENLWPARVGNVLRVPATTSRNRLLVTAGITLVTGLILGALLAPRPDTAPILENLAKAKDERDASLEVNERLRDQLDDAKTVSADAIAELEAREAAVAAREAAVTVTETTIKANTIPGNGVFIVGTDVQPGTYRSEGGSNCYWARLNASGDDIIDNALGSGQSVLTVQAGDGLIEISGCEPFTKIG